jgi:hypothetical protein
MPATKPRKVTLDATPSALPQLLTVSELNSRAALVRAKNSKVVAFDAPVVPAPADGNPPVADTTTIPGIALATTVQGFVDGLSVIGFDATISIDRRAAVLNSLTFAMLAANGDVAKNPAADYVSQFASYLTVCGFTVAGSASGSYDSGNLSISLDKALLDCLSTISTDISSVNLLKDVITALKTLPENQGALTLFSHNTIRNGSAKIATVSATQPNGAAGLLQLKLALFEFAFSSTETRILWIKVDNSKSKMNYTSVTCELQDAAYASVADGLTQRVADFRKSTISSVDLSL